MIEQLSTLYEEYKTAIEKTEMRNMQNYVTRKIKKINVIERGRADSLKEAINVAMDDKNERERETAAQIINQKRCVKKLSSRISLL